MNNPPALALFGVTAIVLVTCIAASPAVATTLSIEGTTQSGPVSVTATLASGTTTTVEDSSGTTTDTCTSSELKASTESPFTGSSVGAAVSTLTFGGCSHTTKVIKNGSLLVAWTSGTNGTVTSTGAEVTVKSTVFGISAVCKTGAGTDLGTITGVGSGHATMHLDATKSMDCGAFLGKASWTGSYTFTSPTGLAVAQ